jgi:hypothetical protein
MFVIATLNRRFLGNFWADGGVGWVVGMALIDAAQISDVRSPAYKTPPKSRLGHEAAPIGAAQA